MVGLFWQQNVNFRQYHKKIISLGDYTVKKHKCQGFEGPCENMNATYNRQGSNYVKNKLNYAWLCPSCQKLSYEYWREMWHEYYSYIFS